MASYSSEDELPELSAILAPKPLMATSTNSNLRRSPRKKGTVTRCPSGSPEKKDTVARYPSGSPEKRQQPRNTSPSKSANPAPVQPTTKRIYPTKSTKLPSPGPIMSRNPILAEFCLTSNNRQSPARERRPLKVPHMDSLLLPRSATAKQDQPSNPSRPVAQANAGRERLLSGGEKSMMSLMTEAARKSEIRQSARKRTQVPSYASRFVLKEARCNDDEEDSMDEEDEDEDTDLSGFIVDDDAELSYHDSSASESDRENKTRSSRPSAAPRRKRLHRGSPTRRRLSFSDDDAENDKEDNSSDGLADAFQDLGIHEDSSRISKSKDIEVVDLTLSPNTSPKFDLNKLPQPILSQPQVPAIKPANTGSGLSNPFNDFDATLKLAPPVSETSTTLPSKMGRPQYSEDASADEAEDPLSDDAHDKFKTPPRTPPKSKLNSPSKLLSPSKRQYVPRSPHRPSMDAFWDHNVINDWNDEFSPKKSPAKYPRKGLARFQIYSDSDSDDDNNSANISGDSLPSPCTPPRKSTSRPQSPLKSPEKEEKKRLIDQKKAAAAKKKDFDARKEKLALDLLHELDSNVAKSQLSKLASSTGGIRIVWSKTLRSTAGRANWRRTASKISGSPIKGGVTGGPGVEIKHFASIELAEKIIDCEDRLINTLAHEFCHLTNFMISNVRDQPHGASFKSWAAKVTTHLRKSEVEMWRKVEVTTKHNYAINHKYMWVCVGREQTKTMEFLNIDEDDGCGAEYGRHSRSIDTAKHRCGKCKGKLVQVRPKPRAPASPRKQLRSRESSAASSESGSANSSQSTLGGLVEMVELSD